MRRAFLLLFSLGLAASWVGGCATVSTYTKPEAPWGTIRKVAIVPFVTPSENPARRQLMTQLFAEELRRTGSLEVVEVPLESTVGPPPKLEEVGRSYQVDAVFSGSVDESEGTVVHLWLHDAATAEVLWSGTYFLGMGPEYFSVRSPQQKIQRAYERLVSEFSGSLGASSFSEVAGTEVAGSESVSPEVASEFYPQ